jgi:hypothetical protein
VCADSLFLELLSGVSALTKGVEELDMDEMCLDDEDF